MTFSKPFKRSKLLSLLLPSLTVVLTMTSSTTKAAEVEVEWRSPEKYRDIHAGEGFQDDYQEGVFFNLDKHFKKLAKKLPEKNRLKIIVTDLDLAGDVHSGSIDLIRIVSNPYPPRISFDYQYLDSRNKVILAESVNYRDVSFMAGSTRYRGHYLAHEKKLLDRWFKKEFLKKLTAK